MAFSLCRSGGIVGVKDERGREHVRQQRDGVERGSNGARIGRLDDDDQLAPRVARVDFAAREAEDRGSDLVKPERPSRQGRRSGPK
jgi:hypothetical protein